LAMRHRKQKVSVAIPGIEDTFSTEAEQCSLFGLPPADVW